VTTTTTPGLFISAGQTKSLSPASRNTRALGIFREVLGIDMETARDTLSTLPGLISFDDIIYHISNMRRNVDDAPDRPDIELAWAITAANEAKRQLEAPALGYVCDVILPGAATRSGSTIVDTLAQYIRNGLLGTHRVVLLIGPTGVGKTSMTRSACELAGIAYDEFYDVSIPTMQPEDLAGIPFPDPSDPRFFYYRMSRELFGKKVMFFDEANRANSTKTFDAMMQLVLERKINGHRFDEIQAIVLAINPDDGTDDYSVETFDKAFYERIDHTLYVPATYSAEVIGKNIGNRQVAEIGVKWVMELGDSSRAQLNPRRLQKMLLAYTLGEDIKTTLDAKRYTVPIDKLIAALNSEQLLTLERLLDEPEWVEKQMQAGGKLAGDIQYRFVELMHIMQKRGMRREIVTVAHLYKYVKRDLLPRLDRDKPLHMFLNSALKREATDEQREAFFRILAERQSGLDALASDISQIAKRMAEEPDDAMAPQNAIPTPTPRLDQIVEGVVLSETGYAT